jgi:hypothetical protein
MKINITIPATRDILSKLLAARLIDATAILKSPTLTITEKSEIIDQVMTMVSTRQAASLDNILLDLFHHCDFTIFSEVAGEHLPKPESSASSASIRDEPALNITA